MAPRTWWICARKAEKQCQGLPAHWYVKILQLICSVPFQGARCCCYSHPVPFASSCSSDHGDTASKLSIKEWNSIRTVILRRPNSVLLHLPSALMLSWFEICWCQTQAVVSASGKPPAARLCPTDAEWPWATWAAKTLVNYSLYVVIIPGYTTWSGFF